MNGRTARPDCFTAASATRRHRSTIGTRGFTTVCAVTTGRTSTAPIITASRTTSSNPSPLMSAGATTNRTGGSGAHGATSPTCTRTAARVASTTVAAKLPPSPSNTCTGAAGPRRSTRVRCAPSSVGSVATRPCWAPGRYTRGMLIVVETVVRLAGPADARGPRHHAMLSLGRTHQLPLMLLRGQTLGKYRIVSPLGSGGFGTVYLAEDTWIDKKVAIKVPHKQTLDFGELLKEPRLLAALGHPNIVSVITAEKQDNVFFIVMEY